MKVSLINFRWMLDGLNMPPRRIADGVEWFAMTNAMVLVIS